MPLKRATQCLLIFLAFSLAACQPVQITSPTPAHTLAPSATVTVTPVWFPPTSTPVPAATALPSTPTPPLPADLGVVLLSDDFSAHQLWQTGRMDAGNVAYGANELSLAVALPKGSLVSLRDKTSLGDFFLEITISPSLCLNNDTYGLLFRVVSAVDFYRLLISCSGQLRLERLVNGQGTLLQDWMLSPQITPGVPDAFRLGVWASGDKLRFYINNVFQFSRQDAALTTGSIGVFARAAGDNAVTVSFSDLIVYQAGSAK
jgi:hypothetical protein